MLTHLHTHLQLLLLFSRSLLFCSVHLPDELAVHLGGHLLLAGVAALLFAGLLIPIQYQLLHAGNGPPLSSLFGIYFKDDSDLCCISALNWRIQPPPFPSFPFFRSGHSFHSGHLIFHLNKKEVSSTRVSTCSWE